MMAKRNPMASGTNRLLTTGGHTPPPATAGLNPHAISPADAQALLTLAQRQIAEGVPVIPMPAVDPDLSERENSFVLAYIASGFNIGLAMRTVDPFLGSSRDPMAATIAGQRAQEILSNPHVATAIARFVTWLTANLHHFQLGNLIAMHQLVTDPTARPDSRIGASKMITAIIEAHQASIGVQNGKESAQAAIDAGPQDVLSILRQAVESAAQGAVQGAVAAVEDARDKVEVVDLGMMREQALQEAMPVGERVQIDGVWYAL